MNGESKRSFALALASFVIGAVVVGVLSNPETRAKISASSRNIVKSTKNLTQRTDLA